VTNQIKLVFFFFLRNKINTIILLATREYSGEAENDDKKQSCAKRES
jgi:hypothetical protein